MSIEQRNLFETVRKESQVVGVTSEWVCEYSRASYVMLEAGKAVSKCELARSYTNRNSAIAVAMMVWCSIMCSAVDYCDV